MKKKIGGKNAVLKSTTKKAAPIAKKQKRGQPKGRGKGRAMK